MHKSSQDHSGSWYVGALESGIAARIQDALKDLVEIDRERALCDFTQCTFGAIKQRGFERTYYLRDTSRRRVGAAKFRESRRNKDLLNDYFAVLLCDGTTFEGCHKSGDMRTLVCFCNGAEICRVIEQDDKEAVGRGLIKWIRRNVLLHRTWRVEVGCEPVGTIAVKYPITWSKQLLYLETFNAVRLPIRIMSAPLFGGDSLVIPKECGVCDGQLVPALLFALNIAFRISLLYIDFIDAE